MRKSESSKRPVLNSVIQVKVFLMTVAQLQMKSKLLLLGYERGLGITRHVSDLERLRSSWKRVVACPRLSQTAAIMLQRFVHAQHSWSALHTMLQ
jgi:hypothetical protein